MSKGIVFVCSGLASSESQPWTVNHFGVIPLHLIIASNQYEAQPLLEMRADLNILK
jgi:hypothetical protein